MLCHTATGAGEGPKMSDSSSKIEVRRMPFREGKKILRATDHRSNYLVDATFGTETVQRVLADEKNVVIPYNEIELDGYEIDPFATRKWPYVAVKSSGAVVRTSPPKAGRYHVGFMMYDDGADERVVVSVSGKMRGVAVARLGTRRTWLYWLQDAIDFAGDEAVELKAMGSGGKHGIAYVVFLSEPPEPRSLPLEVDHMVAVADPCKPGQVTLSWTTSWPSRTVLKWSEAGKEPKLVEEGSPCLAHRVILDGLSATTYEAQAIGEGPEGESFEARGLRLRPWQRHHGWRAKRGRSRLRFAIPIPSRWSVGRSPGACRFHGGAWADGANVRLVVTEGRFPFRFRPRHGGLTAA